MNYYESAAMDYLRADRAIFVNPEFCIQTNKAANPDNSGPHWYCDAVALDFNRKEIFLCEISYAVAALEEVQPWLYSSWNRNGEDSKQVTSPAGIV